MLYAGLDYHKRYSVVQTMDEQGRQRGRARLPNEFEAVRGYFDGLGEPCKVVLEAGWNWGTMFDWPEGTTAGYFEPVKRAVRPGMMFNFYNPQDYAVGDYRPDSPTNGSWLLDQFVKPYRIVYQLNPANWLGFKYGASGLTDEEKEYFIRNANRQDKFCLSLPLNLPFFCDASFQCVGDMTNFADPEERFRILAFGGRSRSKALEGLDASHMPDPNVSGFTGRENYLGNVNLQEAPFKWKYNHVYHDGQFWGCFAMVQGYWKRFMENIGMTPR